MADSEIRPDLKPPQANGRRTRERVRRIGDRQVITAGLEPHGWGDFYHDAMTVSWPVFFAVLAGAFVLLNAAFACVYLCGATPIANARPESFSDLFFFSVETTSTVGYGDMHPQTMFGHVVATIENFVGLVSFAMMTGLTYARFSRPRARLIFARNPVIFLHDGVPTLAIRIANARNSFISEATAKLWMLGPIKSPEGRGRVSFQPMKLTKNENPSFALTWTLFHPIDAESPLAEMSESDLAASEVNYVLTVSGFDESAGQAVRARNVYAARVVRYNHEFIDIFSVDERGLRRVDYALLHDTRETSTSVFPP